MSGTSVFSKNAMLTNGVNPVITNTPSQYANRQRAYFDAESRLFIERRARYASDFFDAEVQGLDDGDPTAWGTYRIRFADVVRANAAIQRDFDDYKQYLFESRKIEYVRPGTKIVTMGNTWLVTNPNNISGASGSGICRRCNAVWNYYDKDGNVCSEPIVVENARANANDSDVQNSQLITKGYFNVTCQYNDMTRQIDTNTRLILGTGAYRVTGYSDFDMEFFGDYSTVRLLSFTVRYEEPNYAIDDMENHIAGGLAWLRENAEETTEPTVTDNGVAFTSAIPSAIGMFESVTLTAAYFENGLDTGADILFSFSGADESAYSAAVSGNSATITGYGYSDTPLTITASCGDSATSVVIALEGM